MLRTEPDNTEVSYSYHISGQVETVTTASGVTTYHYTDLNQLAKVIAPNGDTTIYTYNDVGNLIRTERPNGTSQNYEYDELNQIVYQENTDSTGTVLSSYRYTYDDAGNKTSVEENTGRRVEYQYDALNRLTQEIIFDPEQGTQTISYAFDAVGNRLTKDDSVEGLTTYTYDRNDRLLSETTEGVTTTYTYDDNGNLVSEASGEKQTTYFWNSENRLIGSEITDANGIQQIEYTYDADGIRIAKTVDGEETRYLVDANRQYAQVLEEYDATTGTEVSYVYGGNELISQSREGDSSFYLYDSHSGTRQLTDRSVAVTDSYLYDAYGNILKKSGDTENSYLYRGEQTDNETGLQYLRARYNNTSVGRLISVDPFEGETGIPMSRHRYTYGYNNPVMYIDPSGAISISATQKLAVLKVVTSVLLSLYATAAGQAALSIALQKTTGRVDWIGHFVGVDTPLIGGRGTVLNAKAIQDTRIVGIGPERPFEGKWVQVAAGIDLGDFLGGKTPSNPIINDGVVLTSPRWPGANPGTLSGVVAIGGLSNGDLSGQSVVIGLGIGFIGGLRPDDVPAGIPGFASYIGLSLPWRGSDRAITGS